MALINKHDLICDLRVTLDANTNNILMYHQLNKTHRVGVFVFSQVTANQNVERNYNTLTA